MSDFTVTTSTAGSIGGTPYTFSFNGVTGPYLGANANSTGVETYSFSTPVYKVQVTMVAVSTRSGSGVREEVSFQINGKDVVLNPSNLVQYGNGTTNTLVTTASDGSGRSVIVGVEDTYGNSGGIYTIVSSTPINTFTITDRTKGDSAGSIFQVNVAKGIETPGPGVTLSSLMPATSDIDATSTLKGWAITSAAADSTGHHWQYSLDNGSSWVNLDSASTAAARFISASSLIRWTGLLGNNTKLDAVAVDDTSTASAGAVIDVTNRGGTTPYSANIATLAASAGPIVLDLNHDQQLQYSHVLLDMDGDGVLDRTAWAAASDGVLVWNKFGDATLHDNSQFAFAQYGGSTDLQGLAAGFDSNKDGVFSTDDASFAQFGVWQDVNQDGKVGAGEFHTLIDLGVTAIDLSSDGVLRHPVQGVIEFGQSQASLQSGGQMLLGDVAFSYESVSGHVIHADAANPVLQGTAGVDVFRWDLASKGSQDSVPLSIVKDFDMADGGDKLDLRDLLTGEHHAEGDVGNLLDYLHFSVEGNSTVIDVKSQGAGAPVDQKILLEGVDLSFGGALQSDQQMLQHLLNHGKLIVD